MGLGIRNLCRAEATVVSNEFIDRQMSSVNGEYVKVYLFLLRHEGEDITVSAIADALNHTEADVRRALTYWKKSGVLGEAEVCEDGLIPEIQDAVRLPGSAGSGKPGSAGSDKPGSTGSDKPGSRPDEPGGAGSQAPLQEPEQKRPMRPTPAQEPEYHQPSPQPQPAAPRQARPKYSQDQVNRLSGDEDFTQLLYIAQKYMNKVFTQRDCEVFAYLYDALHMTAELLEYVVEYCVQGGHSNIRYIETVALNWHEAGINTVETAKLQSASFTKDTFAVMKAFGINDRKPGESEREMIDKWFKSYGFTKELVLEACDRTLKAIHAPSFAYADKILSEWRKAGVKSLADVKVLDQKRQGGREEAGRQAGAPRPKGQFHNIPQRETDYDAMILKQLREQ